MVKKVAVVFCVLISICINTYSQDLKVLDAKNFVFVKKDADGLLFNISFVNELKDTVLNKLSQGKYRFASPEYSNTILEVDTLGLLYGNFIFINKNSLFDSSVAIVKASRATKQLFYHQQVLFHKLHFEDKYMLLETFNAAYQYHSASEALDSIDKSKIHERRYFYKIDGKLDEIIIEYNLVGRKVKVTDKIKNADTTFYQNGKIEQVQLHQSNTTYIYTPSGSLSTKTYSKNGLTITESYQHNKLVKKEEGSGGPDKSVFFYKNGVLFQKEVRSIDYEKHQLLIILYDAKGKVIKQTREGMDWETGPEPISEPIPAPER